jgi:carboxyl-terminal processing protease
MAAPPAFADGAFTDIDGPYTKAIRYLKSKDVVSGYGNGEYRPHQQVTRAEFIKMVISNQDANGLGKPVRLTYPFQDVPNEAWYAESIQRAWDAGLIDSKTLLHPNDPITRVEGAKLMINMLGLPLPRFIDKDEWPLNYRDVRYDTWYAPIVMYGSQYGIIKPLGPNGDYFRPLKRLTRGEAASLIYNTDVYLLGTQIFDGAAELKGQLIDEGIAHDIPNLDILADVWNRIQTNYFYPGKEDFDEEALVHNAIRGMVEGLDDEYSAFLDPPESEELTEFLEGEFGGIGAEIAEEDGFVIIRSLLIDSPAESSGLLPNDRIVEVNGEDVRGESPQSVASVIRGEIGTDVIVTIERGPFREQKDYTITRDTIDIGYLKAEMIGDAIYVDINLFTSLGFIEFKQAIDAVIAENPDFKGFIFDVRDNPGGYLNTVKSVLGHFIPRSHTLLYVKTGPMHSQQHISEGQGEWEDYPIVMLINEGSASASEIMALTLFERNKASLVGQTTYGKGTVQEVIDYKDGSSLKLTIAEWRSLNFHSINEIGISPQEYAELTEEDIAAGRDPQLDAALKEFDLIVGRWEKEKAEEAAAALLEESN